MQRFSPTFVTRLSLAGVCGLFLIPTPASIAQVSVKSAKVLGSRDTVEIEVEGSDRLAPQTRVLTGPDRLVIDFPNAIPGNGLRNQSVDRGEVKDLRFGLFQSNPPITRLVLDLKTARSFQVFPYGRTVMIKVSSGADIEAAAQGYPPATRPGLVAANYVNRTEAISGDAVNYAPAPAKPLEVTFRDGMLAIHANKATLSEVLYAVQQRTGAEVSIAAGAEQEKVVADIGPAPAPEVLAALLNGSKFNFLILNAANDPRQLDRVILTPRTEGGFTAPPPTAQTPEPTPAITADDEDAPPQIQPPQQPPQPARAPNGVPGAAQGAQGEGKPQDTSPDM